MLASVHAEDFVRLIGRTCNFARPNQPDMHLRIIGVKPGQLAGPCGVSVQSLPFVVEMACEPEPGLTDTLGDLELPPCKAGLPRQRLEHIWIGRVTPGGRDPKLAYFQLPFG